MAMRFHIAIYIPFLTLEYPKKSNCRTNSCIMDFYLQEFCTDSFQLRYMLVSNYFSAVYFTQIPICFSPNGKTFCL